MRIRAPTARASSRASSPSVEAQGTARAGDKKHQYLVRVVPKMWLLKRRKNTRIFQQATLVDIINEVFAQARITRRWDLTQTYPLRSYCVQYRETDYHFVKRLLAEEGIFFYFEPPAGLLDQLTGGFAGAVAGAASGIVRAPCASASIGGAVSGLEQAFKLDETVVLCDSAQLYPPIQGGLETLLGSAVGAAIEAFVPDSGPASKRCDRSSLP